MLQKTSKFHIHKSRRARPLSQAPIGLDPRSRPQLDLDFEPLHAAMLSERPLVRVVSRVLGAGLAVRGSTTLKEVFRVPLSTGAARPPEGKDHFSMHMHLGKPKGFHHLQEERAAAFSI
eukprot:2033249-Amphidinium_carterae.1